MKRMVNIRLLALLIVSVALLGAGVHVLHAMQIKRSARILLETADVAQAKGDLEAAEDDLGRYLGFVPNDSDALARYALVLASETLANSPVARTRALAVADKALIHDPDRNDVRRKAIGLAMVLGDFDAARSHLTTLLDREPDDAELEFLLGKCEEENRQFHKATAWYEKVIKHAPHRIDAYVRLADLLRSRLDQPQRADEVMDAREVKNGLIAANSQSYVAYLERAKYRKAYGLAGADADLAHALELAPDRAETLLAAAEAARDQDAVEEARAHLKHASELYPQEVQVYRTQASLDMHVGAFDEAVKVLKQGIETVPNPAPLQWALADLLIQVGRIQDARDVIELLRKARYQPELLEYLDGRLAMAGERWLEAVKILEVFRTRLATQPHLGELKKQTCLLLAECYRQIGNVEQRYNACLTAVAMVVPGDRLEIPTRLELAAALTAMGRLDGAIAEYQKLLSLAKAPAQAKLNLARLLVLKTVNLPVAQRRWNEVEQILDGLELTAPELASAVVTTRVEILAASDQLGRAQELLEKARDQHPDQVELWTTLAVVSERQRKAQEALSILDQAQQRLNDRVELRLARAAYWQRRGGPEAATALTALEKGTEQLRPAGRRQLLDGLATLHLRSGDGQAAQRLWTQLVKEEPDNLNVRLNLFELALQNRDASTIDQLLSEIRRIEGEDGILWRLARVQLLIEQVRARPGDVQALTEARALMVPVAARRPMWSEVALAEAQIDDLLGIQTSALKNYLRAIDLGNQSWLAVRRAIRLLIDRGRFEQADQVMRKLDDKAPLTSELQRLAAGISARTHDFQRTLELTRKAVPPSSRDYRDQLWLGRVFWTGAQRAQTEGRRPEVENHQREAERAFRRAVALAGNMPETWVALVRFLAATQQPAAAGATVREAEATLPKEWVPLARAECCAALGQLAQAEAMYQDAINATPDNVAVRRSAATFYLNQGRLADAEPHLRRLIQLQRHTPDEAARARRVLAFLLAASGNRQQSAEAMELLGLSTTDDAHSSTDMTTLTLDDRRARAEVLALQPLRSQRRRAIQILEQIAEDEFLTASDLYLLGQLYDADGDWSRSRAYLQKLMTTNDGSPLYSKYILYYTHALLRHGQAAEAQIWLGRLEQRQPDSPGTIELKARVLAAQNRGEEAAKLLMAFCEHKDSQVAATAALLEELGQVKSAEVLYRRFVSLPGPPEQVLALVTFLARQRRLVEALEICERAWQTCPPETVGNASVVMLYATTPERAQFQRVERWITTAIERNPGSISLRFDLANLMSLEERHSDAEAIYRQMIERKEGSTAPLNNLAWLLAIRGGKTEEALTCIERARAIDGSTPNLLDTRALVLLALDRSSDAIKDLEDASAVAPSAILYVHLAAARLRAGDRTKAAETLQAARVTGLHAETLHPLERAFYTRLNDELTRN
jgi:tetratricopeptide (TPR) repeat protein